MCEEDATLVQVGGDQGARGRHHHHRGREFGAAYLLHCPPLRLTFLSLSLSIMSTFQLIRGLTQAAAGPRVATSRVLDFTAV